MAWTDPDTGTIGVGDVATAAWANTYVRDNMKALRNYITGKAGSGGSVVAGSGWSISRTSAGHYTITFDSAFAAAPVVVVTRHSSGSSPSVSSVTTGGFVVSFVNSSGGADTDTDFDFIATAVV